MPERRGIWLYSYEDIKRRRPFTWFAYSVLAALALLGACGFGGLALYTAQKAGLVGFFVYLAFVIAMLAYSIIELPAGIIYLVRRRRGEPVDMWDCETPYDPAVKERATERGAPIELASPARRESKNIDPSSD